LYARAAGSRDFEADRAGVLPDDDAAVGPLLRLCVGVPNRVERPVRVLPALDLRTGPPMARGEACDGAAVATDGALVYEVTETVPWQDLRGYPLHVARQTENARASALGQAEREQAAVVRVGFEGLADLVRLRRVRTGVGVEEQIEVVARGRAGLVAEQNGPAGERGALVLLEFWIGRTGKP